MNYSNFNQVVHDLSNLNKHLENIRHQIVDRSKIKYTSQDARQVALDSMQCDIAACGNWICALISLKNITQEQFNDYWEVQYQKLIGTKLATYEAEDLMLDYLRNTITTKIHFRLENLFNNILEAFSITPKHQGFWNLSNSVLELSGLSIFGYEKNILTALANLRNSFHGNGIHKKDNLNLEIDGIKFEFRKGNSINCSSWKHIVLILRENIIILETILLSERISMNQKEILDIFSTCHSHSCN